MNKKYLKDHLLKLMELMCGKENRDTCFSKKIEGKYHFGYRKNGKKITNIVSRQVAMYLAIGVMTYNEIEGKKPTKRKRKDVSY